ncbi:MAG: ABC transporter ATP-binding protein [Bacteriovoracaceae bacterium]|nr:ABC transporter ATP-binding protein [Bacteriovoracaceae bacterium]
MSTVELKEISKTFDSKGIPALRSISFALDKSERVSLIGPSGTGKTTLLRIIMGQVSADSGTVELNESKVGILEEISFDEESMLVSDYIQLNLNGDALENENRMREMIELFSLFYKEKRKISELSLGQKKRVAFAKALAPRPNILLMDEPFANLDDFLKRELREEVFDYLSKLEISSLFVTHDLSEALLFSTRCLFLDDGEIRQVGEPEELYNFPRDSHVARFFGPCNLFSLEYSDDLRVKFDWGEFQLQKQSPFIDKDATHVYLMVRPHEWVLGDKGLKVKIISKTFLGEFIEYICSGDLKNNVYVRVPSSTFLSVGDHIQLVPNTSLVRLIPV